MENTKIERKREKGRRSKEKKGSGNMYEANELAPLIILRNKCIYVNSQLPDYILFFFCMHDFDIENSLKCE